jgi:hypothetical protein
MLRPSRRFTSGLHEPQPIPAPLLAHRSFMLVQPSSIFLRIFSLPTLLQLQTSLPKYRVGFVAAA